MLTFPCLCTQTAGLEAFVFLFSLFEHKYERNEKLGQYHIKKIRVV